MSPKKSLTLSFCFVPSALALAIGCGGGSGGAGGTGGTGGTGGSGDGPCGLATAANEEFCSGDAVTPDCNLVSAFYKNHVCGVPLKDLSDELARSTPAQVQKYGGDGPPDLSCFEVGNYPAPPDASQMVTMEGIAEIFSNGCESDNVQIEVYTVKRTGGADDGDLDQLIGTAVATVDDCTAVGAGVASMVDDCPDQRYECFYSYPGVPTETELLIKTGNKPGDPLNKWGTVYEYNVFIRNTAVQNGIWSHDVRALAQEDYGVISAAAIGGPITAGNGAIAGEVHDCGDVRLTNALVDIDKPKVIVTYFSNDENNPLPDTSAKGTSILGLYAAIDVAPGPVVLAAGGRLGGEFTTAGFFRARIFPDSVSVVTFRGLPVVELP